MGSKDQVKKEKLFLDRPLGLRLFRFVLCLLLSLKTTDGIADCPVFKNGLCGDGRIGRCSRESDFF